MQTVVEIHGEADEIEYLCIYTYLEETSTNDFLASWT